MNTAKLQIFYTDDDSDDQEFFRDAISEIGDNYLVFTQNHGDELLHLLNEPPPTPDIVFLDLNMPYKNGFQVLQEIRGTAMFDHIPVIVFSTSNNEKSIETCKKYGANMYLSKPNSYTDLIRIISDVLAMDWKNFEASGSQFIYTSN
jgi:CheY-like chemotaxis protein